MTRLLVSQQPLYITLVYERGSRGSLAAWEIKSFQGSVPRRVYWALLIRFRDNALTEWWIFARPLPYSRRARRRQLWGTHHTRSKDKGNAHWLPRAFERFVVVVVVVVVVIIL